MSHRLALIHQQRVYEPVRGHVPHDHVLSSSELGEMLESDGVVTIETDLTSGKLPDQPDPPPGVFSDISETGE